MPLIAPNKIVRDWSLYPRENVEVDHVYVLKEALRAGAELPPLVVEQESKRLIDGFHRLAAWEELHGDATAIPVRFKRCPDKAAFLLESIRANASHGRPLSYLDRDRCLVLAENLAVDPAHVAKALNLTVNRAVQLTKDAVKPPSQKPKVPKGLRKTGRGGAHAYDQPRNGEMPGGADQRTRLAFYAGQLRVALMNKSLPVSLHESLLLLHRDLVNYLSHENLPMAIADEKLARLRKHLLEQDFDKGDIDAVLNRFEQRHLFGGNPVTDPAAWCTAGLRKLANARRNHVARSGPLIIELDGEKFERTTDGGLRLLDAEAT